MSKGYQEKLQALAKRLATSWGETSGDKWPDGVQKRFVMPSRLSARSLIQAYNNSYNSCTEYPYIDINTFPMELVRILTDRGWNSRI